MAERVLYEVVHVAKTAGYPLEWQVNADKYPALRDAVEDDYGVFVVEVDNRSNWWPDTEFFRMVNVVDFLA